MLLLLSFGAAAAQTCPTGGVLDPDRAYFGSFLSANTCSPAGARCPGTFFFEHQRVGTAVCVDGRYVLDAEFEPERTCPEFVLSETIVWDNGRYLQNTCDPQAAAVCGNAYFYRLPEGGAGYREAICRNGTWQPDVDPGDGEAFAPSSRAARGRYLRPTSSRGFKRLGAEALRLPLVPSPMPKARAALFLAGLAVVTRGGIPVSGTNVQEAGVDEADRMKSDGSKLFLLKNFQVRAAGQRRSARCEKRRASVRPRAGATRGYGSRHVSN